MFFSPRFLLVLIALPLLVAQQSTAKRTREVRVYLQLEGDQKITAFNKPGYDWRSCNPSTGCEAIGWLPSDASVYAYTGTEETYTRVDPTTGRTITEQFSRVRFTYLTPDRKDVVKKEGWIPTRAISSRELRSVYSPSAQRPQDCADHSDPLGDFLQQLTGKIQPVERATTNNNLDNTVEKIRPYIGNCVINPKIHPEDKGNNYDGYALETILKSPLPQGVYNQQGEPISQRELIAIDALARTLYGELASCFKYGLQYPMAAAKVALNRASLAYSSTGQKYKFVKGTHSPDKGTFAKVVTSASQFNVWYSSYLEKGVRKKNPTLKQALCPPSDNKKSFYTGSLPNENEKSIWTSTLKIATEAVLYPGSFDRRTSDVRQTEYSSYMKGPPWEGFVRVYPSIQGRVVNNECAQIWAMKNIND